jgi:hypothetical protein
MRVRAEARNAPAEPTTARIAVGFSGERAQPFCACRGRTAKRRRAKPRNIRGDFFIDGLHLRRYWHKSRFVNEEKVKVAQISCCNGASGLAVDQGGNVWVANYFGSSISEVSSAGAVLLNGQTGGGVDHPNAVAIDGAGHVWVANLHKSTVSEFAGYNAASPGAPLSPAAGLGTDAQLGSPFALAIDASGNLWVSNSVGANTVTVFVGLATPVKTPLLGPPQLP